MPPWLLENSRMLKNSISAIRMIIQIDNTVVLFYQILKKEAAQGGARTSGIRIEWRPWLQEDDAADKMEPSEKKRTSAADSMWCDPECPDLYLLLSDFVLVR